MNHSCDLNQGNAGLTANADIQELLKLNLPVDEATLKLYREMSELLKKWHVSKKEYDLASPFSLPPLLNDEENATDPRMIDLTFLRSW